jgi:hypothetical protein
MMPPRIPVTEAQIDRVVSQFHRIVGMQIETLEHVAQKWEPVLSFSNMRIQ